MLVLKPVLCTAEKGFKIETDLNFKIQSVPRSKHSVSVIKTSQLMLCREIIAVCSESHTEDINTLRGQNVLLLLYYLINLM